MGLIEQHILNEDDVWDPSILDAIEEIKRQYENKKDYIIFSDWFDDCVTIKKYFVNDDSTIDILINCDFSSTDKYKEEFLFRLSYWCNYAYRWKMLDIQEDETPLYHMMDILVRINREEEFEDLCLCFFSPFDAHLRGYERRDY